MRCRKKKKRMKRIEFQVFGALDRKCVRSDLII